MNLTYKQASEVLETVSTKAISIYASKGILERTEKGHVSKESVLKELWRRVKFDSDYEHVTYEEASIVLGCTVDKINSMVYDGRLRTHKSYHVTLDSIQKYKKLYTRGYKYKEDYNCEHIESFSVNDTECGKKEVSFIVSDAETATELIKKAMSAN